MAYIILALAGLAAIALTVKKWGRPAEITAVCLTASSFCSMADWVAHGWLGLYRYHPGFLDNPFADSLVGAVCAEYIFVGGLSVFMTAFLPQWAGVVAGVSVVTVIEYLFESRGWLLYRGWSLWLTTSGFTVFFSIVQLYAKRVLKMGLANPPLQRIARIGLVLILSSLWSVAVTITGVAESHIQLLPSKQGSEVMFRFVKYMVFVSTLGYWVLAENRSAVRWARTAVAMLLVGVLNLGLVWLRAVTLYWPWNWLLNTLSIGGLFCVANLLDRWLSAHASVIVPEWQPPCD